MFAIKDYLLSVTAAALVCGIVTSLAGKGSITKLLKLICGLFLTATVIKPAVDVRVENIYDFAENLNADSEMVVSQGEYVASEEMKRIIKQKTETYILDKAKALGAEIIFKEDYIEAVAGSQGLIGDTIYLDFPSVGATENIMMAAVLAQGTTYIENAAEEPEIVDLANFLNKMGAKIKGAGTDTIKIEGVTKLGGARHTVIPDRIETGTFMLAAAITKGAVHIINAVPDHVKPIIAKLRECGVRIEVGDDDIIIRADLGPQSSTDIKTLPYPGFPTDIQSPFMAYLTTVEGSSTVIETVFENRFMHVAQLNKMGAHIETAGNKAVVRGNSRLRGSHVMATDLRAGAALVLAGLVAEGQTEISEIYHIERGYEKFIEKFRELGAHIERIDD